MPLFIIKYLLRWTKKINVNIENFNILIWKNKLNFLIILIVVIIQFLKFVHKLYYIAYTYICIHNVYLFNILDS